MILSLFCVIIGIFCLIIVERSSKPGEWGFCRSFVWFNMGLQTTILLLKFIGSLGAS